MQSTELCTPFAATLSDTAVQFRWCYQERGDSHGRWETGGWMLDIPQGTGEHAQPIQNRHWDSHIWR